MDESTDLIRRTTVEVGPADEVERVESNLSSATAYVGYEPSGVLHLGHLITAQKIMDLQEAGIDVTILMADVHAQINGKGSLDEIQETGEQMWKQLQAFGVEDSAEMVFGSSFQYEKSYQQKLHMLQEEVSLNRAKRAMSEIASGETPVVGHVVYPLMQALDIHALDVDIAVGGMEQRKVHMLARDSLPKIGASPPVHIHTPLIADLNSGDGKMSSSEGEPISGDDDPETVTEKVNEAFCPPARKQDGKENPVLQLYEYLIFPRFDSVIVERPDEYGGDIEYSQYAGLERDVTDGNLHPQDAKQTLAKYINKVLDSVR